MVLVVDEKASYMQMDTHINIIKTLFHVLCKLDVYL